MVISFRIIAKLSLSVPLNEFGKYVIIKSKLGGLLFCGPLYIYNYILYTLEKCHLQWVSVKKY